MSVIESFFSYINSFATYTRATTSSNVGGIYTPLVPVTLINPRDTSKSVAIPVGGIVDTGAEDTLLNERHAKAIGLDYKKGIQVNIRGAAGGIPHTFYKYKALLKIGTLKPILTDITFGPTEEDDTLIGRSTLRTYVTVLTKDQVRLTEYAEQAEKAKSAYAKALYVSFLNSSNAAANYRNRI